MAEKGARKRGLPNKFRIGNEKVTFSDWTIFAFPLRVSVEVCSSLFYLKQAGASSVVYISPWCTCAVWHG